MVAAWVTRIVSVCLVLAACTDDVDDIEPDAQEAGAGGDTGEGGADGEPSCATDCSRDGLICDADTLTCVCPSQTPDHCENDDMYCTDVMGNDPDHCGDCDTSCPETSVCNNGVCSPEPEVIYDCGSVARVWDLVLADNIFYWVEEGQVLSMAVTGQQVVTQLNEPTTEELSASALALDSSNVYVVSRSKALARIPRTGGVPERVVTETEGIVDLAARDGVLYYTVANEVKSVPGSASEDTGTVVAGPVCFGRPYGVAVDGDHVFWSCGFHGVESPTGTYDVEGSLVSGGNRRTLGATQGDYGHFDLTTDGTHVYWVSGDTLSRRVYDASAEPETSASSHEPHITTFAINGATAYYASTKDPYGLPKSWIEEAVFGDKPRPIARQRDQVNSIVVGDDSVYWTSGCKIMRVDR